MIKRCIAVAGILYILAMGTSACGHQQRVLTTSAKLTLVSTDDIRLAYYEGRDAFCREEDPEYYSDWRECMDPAFRLATAVQTADQAFRAAQRALDASDEDSLRDALPDALSAAGHLLNALEAAGLPIPEDVSKAVETLKSLARVYL